MLTNASDPMPHAALSAEFLNALKARRNGRDFVAESLVASRSALLIVDMQNVFVDPAGALGVSTASAVVPAINRLADGFRRCGSTVAWVRTTFSDSGRGRWQRYFDGLAPGDGGEALRQNFYAGAEGHAFWPGLNRSPADIVVDKDRFSAFVEGASDLEKILQARGVDTLAIAGTLTNVCCESTMRDAMMRDFQCILVGDACAARTDSEHIASLENAARFFGDVMNTEDVLFRLEASA